MKIQQGIHKAPSFLAVDFFCGAGGTTRGLIDAGGYVIAGIDKDDRCKETYCENNRNNALDRQHVRFLKRDIFPATNKYPSGEQSNLYEDVAVLLRQYKKMAPRVPLLFAICAPCQPFTLLSRKELSEERKAGRERDRDLLLEACQFVAWFMPELILSENVSGINNEKYGGVWSNFQSTLESLGYATGTKIVCTSRFGIPQYRKRSILLAVRRDKVLPDRLTEVMGSQILVPESDPDAVMLTVRQAIGHLPPLAAGEQHPKIPNHCTRALSDLNLKRISCAEPGQSNLYMTMTKFGDLSLRCHQRVNAKLQQRCFTDVYTRMDPDRPSPTITTKCHSISNGRFGHFDVNQVRGISLREAAILQSFPEDYIFHPKNMVGPVARMVGNAVPPKLAAFYAEYLTHSVKLRQPL
jgi:DNA (cytosine-5)-methyltransferase 1